MPSAMPLKTSCSRMSIFSPRGAASGRCDAEEGPVLQSIQRTGERLAPGIRQLKLFCENDVPAFYFAENRHAHLDRFMVILRERLVVGGDDAFNFFVQVFQRGADFRT